MIAARYGKSMPPRRWLNCSWKNAGYPYTQTRMIHNPIMTVPAASKQIVTHKAEARKKISSETPLML